MTIIDPHYAAQADDTILLGIPCGQVAITIIDLRPDAHSISSACKRERDREREKEKGQGREWPARAGRGEKKRKRAKHDATPDLPRAGGVLARHAKKKRKRTQADPERRNRKNTPKPPPPKNPASVSPR